MTLNIAPRPVLLAAQPAVAPRFGTEETYDGNPVGTVMKNHSNSTSVANRYKDGKVYPLMVGLRPAQEEMLAGVNTRLDTLNSTLQEGFTQLTRAIQHRFPNT